MKIVVADPNLAPLRVELAAGLPAGTEVSWPDRRDHRAVEAALADADVLVSARCTPAMAAAGKTLRLVHAPGAGVDGIDVTALPAGTVVANTFHHEDSIAEYVLAATILLRRGFLTQDAALRRDEWASPAYDPAVGWGDTLAAATVGLVGFGHIGERAWRRFRAFGARGVAVSRRGEVDAAAHGLAWAGPIGELPASRRQRFESEYGLSAYDANVLVEQGKYAEAIPHLEEDNDNPEALLLLYKAYKQTGAQEDANLLAKRLAGKNEPTVEQALVVPQFRVVLADEQKQAAK